ncbi:alpha-galactosidase [Akkermansiaceae bacterium]|nr:alpha-galactosidase [Akkermansiaceae bacterium]
MKSFSTFLLAALLLPVQSFAERVEHAGCYAEWGDAELTVGNALVERKWTIKDGLLTAVSFKDKASDTEWLRAPGRQAAPHPGGNPPAETRALTFASRTGKLLAVEEESLVVDLTARGGQASFIYQFRIFPSSAGVTVRFTDTVPAVPGAGDLEEGEKPGPDGLEVAAPSARPERGQAMAALEDFMLSPLHLRYTQVELMDQTDHHDELVFEREWLPLQDNFEVSCNVFHLEDALTGNGLAFLKLAPLPHARPVKSPWDAKVAGAARRVTFGGHGYAWTVLAYSGGKAGRIAAMQDYQRCLRKYVPTRDGMFLSNTWGDRSRDSRVNVDFLLKEVEAGARLGVDVVQVDDGWQAGKTGNSAFGKGAWGNFRSANPDFWKPHPERFPNGLKPLVEAARDKGMKFGLWFGPDAENDMENWEKDAEVLLGAFEKEGVDYVKIDAVEMKSSAAEANLHRFYEKVLKESDGRVVFDADATAGLRPGYYGTNNVGTIFLENRYTDWKNYYPHHTLRNLWTLAPHVDPVRLRLEFLNNSRNADKYAGDPLAPSAYPPDTLFATVMFASPLGWFETSNLPESYHEKLPPLVEAWKKEREAIFSGHIIPIGEAPDGNAWTGFCSTAKDRKSARMVVFRELNAEKTWSSAIPLLPARNAKVTVLGGKGSATFENGILGTMIPDTLQYLFLRIDADQ